MTEISTEDYLALLLHHRRIVAYQDVNLVKRTINGNINSVYVCLDRDSFHCAKNYLPMYHDSDKMILECYDFSLTDRDEVKSNHFYNVSVELFDAIEKKILEHKYKENIKTLGKRSWMMGTPLEFDVPPRLIRVHFTNMAYLGDFLPDETGEWLFWPNRTGSAWAAYVLHDIATSLDVLNKGD